MVFLAKTIAVLFAEGGPREPRRSTGATEMELTDGEETDVHR